MSQDLAFFTGQLADLLNGGLPLTRSLDLLHQETHDSKLKTAINDLRGDIEVGRSFSQALSRQDHLFSPLYVGLVQTGEATGDLAPPLLELSQFQQKENETLSRVRQAMIYPLILLSVMAVVVIFLTTMVVPRFEFLFDDLGQSLPWPTVVLLTLSTLLREYLWFMIGAVGFGFWIMGLKFQQLRRWVTLKWGQEFFMERWTRVMASLLRHGFSPDEAFQLSEKSLGLSVRQEFQTVLDRLQEGHSLSAALSVAPIFPPLVSELLSAAEESNSLPVVLDRLSHMFQRRNQQRIKTGLSLLEPLLIVIVSVLVGFVALALLLPIFEMSGGIK